MHFSMYLYFCILIYRVSKTSRHIFEASYLQKYNLCKIDSIIIQIEQTLKTILVPDLTQYAIFWHNNNKQQQLTTYHTVSLS